MKRIWIQIIALFAMLTLSSRVTSSAFQERESLSQLSFPISLSSPQTTGADVVARARYYVAISTRYQVGYEGQLTWCNGQQVPTFDCSGFVYTVFQDLGALNLIGGSRMSSGQYYNWFNNRGQTFTDYNLLKPGDLVVYGNQGVDHIAIYVGGGGIVDTRQEYGECRDVQEVGLSPSHHGSYKTWYSREPYAYLKVIYSGSCCCSSLATGKGWENEAAVRTLPFILTQAGPVESIPNVVPFPASKQELDAPPVITETVRRETNNFPLSSLTSTSYRISKSVWGTGGGRCISGHYVIQGTSGQTTGISQTESKSYLLASGYWANIYSDELQHRIYIPLIQR